MQLIGAENLQRAYFESYSFNSSLTAQHHKIFIIISYKYTIKL